VRSTPPRRASGDLVRATLRCRARLFDARAARAVRAWRARLGIARTVALQRISRRQVMAAGGRRGCGLVGVVLSVDGATIYHTRSLTLEEIVHELLHVAHPAWSEDEVVRATLPTLATAVPDPVRDVGVRRTAARPPAPGEPAERAEAAA
jgi:hypothetical protein